MNNGSYNNYRFLKLKVFGFLDSFTTIQLLDQMSQFGIFDINKTSIDIPWSAFRAKSNEVFMQNAYYGISYNLKEYIEYRHNKPFFFNLEHGLYLGDNYVSKWDLPNTTNSLVTFGDYRKKILKEFGVKHKVHLIGPYIHYAKPFLNEFQFMEIKKKLGKTLLVFPSHSTHDYIKESSSDNVLINFLKDFSRQFETVIVCLYWKDIALGYNKIYEKFGYRCVSAGHMFDFNFLSRLKSIIQLSDYTISNDVGTHIGYCINESKPHFIVKSKIKFVKDEGLVLDKNSNDILSVFSNELTDITKEQLEVVNWYWGLEHKKTQKEMKKLIDDVNIHYNTIKKQKYNSLF